MIDDYVTSEPIPDGMRVAINNSNLSFVKNENILIAVSEFKDNKESYINKLSVKVSDSDIVKVSGIYDFSILPSMFKKTETFKNCKFISLKAQSVGAAVVQLTNSETGQIREIPITVAEDIYLGCRASDVKTHTFKGVLGNWVVETDYYNAQSGGIWVADFDYKKVSGGWNYSMNLYNENYSCGVLEVYNADATLRQIEIIDKFESLTKGIFKCAEAGWILFDDAYQGDLLSFRSSTTAKETRIKDIFVPQGGWIRVADDVSVSVNCAVTNAFDMLFTAWSLVDDIGGIIKGINEISSENVKALTKAAMAKLLVQEEYLKFGEKFQDKFCEKCATEMSLNTINRYASLLFLDVDVLLDNLDVSLNDILKMVWGSGVSVAEGLFEKCAGPYGMILKAMFLIQDASDLINESKDIIKRKTGNISFRCTTPLAGHTDTILKGENVTVDTNGNADSSAILETYRIQSGSKYVNLIKKLTGIENAEYQLYEIALHSSDGEKIQPSGKVTVYIECPYSFATVYKQDENGNWILIDSHKENGMIVFDVDHFCKFLVINDEKVSNSISFDDIKLYKDSTVAISPKITVKEGVTYSLEWSSTDSKIATIDQNGKITGKQKGTCQIACKMLLSDGTVISESCNVTVVVYPTVPKVDLSVYEIDLKPGETNTFSWSMEYANEFAFWYVYDDDGSSKLNYFTESETATIIAQKVGRKEYYLGIKIGDQKIYRLAKIVVNVVAPGLKLETKSLTMNYKDSAVITAYAYDSQLSPLKITYSSSNTKVATVDDNGKVYAAKKGSATITCTVTDSNGNTVTDTCKVTVKYSFGQWLIKILLFGWIWY